MHETENDHDDLERRLLEQRPLPRPGFRSQLRSHLLAKGQRRAARPARLRLLIAAYAGSGLALLLIAAVGVAGAGPLSA